MSAEAAFPNEVSGLIYADEQDPHLNLQVFPGTSTGISVDASPQAVIAFAYWLRSRSGQPVATFHSHPGGQVYFSKRDEILELWAKRHVVAVRQHDAWKCMFFRSLP
ncbi:Mov34/MPN/PAD-1 family protein [Alicyclobacillus curvatus]|jgi:proteasome lid subunit RPN8/RPN11|nr:Mov34/MPN/PAD-1 family protein [Alicyclobacillus curvatus]